MRLLLGSPAELRQRREREGNSIAIKGTYRMTSLVAIIIGGASIAIGVIPVGFESDDLWRWVPVVLGALIAGIQVLARLMLGAGAGLGAVTGYVGNPTHPVVIHLRAVRQGSIRVNDQPRLELDLTASPEGRPDYDVSIKQVVSHAELGSLRPGQSYRGTVDPERADAVRIDWHQPVGDREAASDDVRARLERADQLLGDGLISQAEHDEARRDILDDL